MPVASTKIIKEIFNLIGDFRPKALVGQTYEILNASDLAICTSGTINLEASLLLVPNLMVYKLSRPTYWVGKYLLKIGEKLKYFSMPNLLLNQEVVPELIMEKAYPEEIARVALAILRDKNRQEKMKEAFSQLRLQLGQTGVLEKIAKAILAQL
jgi:lipid-A-disaccharide synthase